MPEIIFVNDFSDGEPTHVPDRPGFRLGDTEKYRKTLAVLWMADEGQRVPGQYILDRLPAGYDLWERQREPPSRHIDRYLYGHPSGKNFDSTVKFWPHMKYLMAEGRFDCECCNCRRANRGPVSSRRVDEVEQDEQDEKNEKDEENEDDEESEEDGEDEEEEASSTTTGSSQGDKDTASVVSNGNSSREKREKEFDTPVEQSKSVNREMTRQFTSMQIEAIFKMPSHMPRVGEIILFHCGERSSVEWKAGIVLELPEERFTYDDNFSEHQVHPSMKGNRVLVQLFGRTPSKSPNDNMEITQYVPMTATRPLVYCYEILEDLPQSEWHPTVRNALAKTSSFALTEKFEIRGQGIFTTVFSKGVWIGPELILVGDMVRVTPFNPGYDFFVVHVSSVQFTFDNLNEDNPPEIRIKLIGKAYTNNPRKYKNTGRAEIAEPPHSIKGVWSDQKWYPVHNYGKPFEISVEHVLGRLHEGKAMEKWFGTGCKLDFGLRGLHAARSSWTQHEDRLHADDQSWFWADSRQAQLELESFNGLVVPQNISPRSAQHEHRLLQIIDDLKGHTKSAEESQSMHEDNSSIDNSYDSSVYGGYLGRKRARGNVAKRTGGRPSGSSDDL